jgi:hypothetical protein
MGESRPKDLSNGTNVASGLTNFFSVFTSIVYSIISHGIIVTPLLQSFTRVVFLPFFPVLRSSFGLTFFP